MAAIGIDIQVAIQHLKNNRLVAIPTETVYGLAANALNDSAVARIFEVKNRPSFDPLIVHIGNLDMISSFCVPLTEVEKNLAERYWPGPMTLILKKKQIVSDLVTSGLDTVGVRMPNHALTLHLLNQLPFPLAAPSANPFGYISPTNAQHVSDQLGDKIEYILDGGPCDIGVESTIMKVEGSVVHVLRLGGLSVDQLRADGFEVIVSAHSSSKPEAPGMLTSHYAPRKTTRPLMITKSNDDHTAVLYFTKTSGRSIDRTLSPNGNLNEAARNLFRLLRELDTDTHSTSILVEFVPDEGLGRAINDRLKRACAMG